MRVLVDEHLNGMELLLRSAGLDCISVKKDYQEMDDEKLVAKAKQNNLVFVTEDVDAAEIARFYQAALIQMVLKAKAVVSEINKLE
ncbi:MAG: DUF5615 family PIN-like protein [Candidatus Bathyarchaeota archaeon]|nr:DUF5615 family PIN-like protein [Candidatus Bathyarchaeota archaeon]